tara:strand:+ start:2381 stop:2683 length:303 start_codon:yes stop_codon:yes gene_type:complete
VLIYILFLLLSCKTSKNKVEKTTLLELLKKREEAKISSLFVRRARSLLESALIGREEHARRVVKVVGEEEEEIELGESEKKSREDQQHYNENKHVVARDD